MDITENMKVYICPHCKKEDDRVGIKQTEIHYYAFSPETGQMEDFHGDETVESQEFFCLSCEK